METPSHDEETRLSQATEQESVPEDSLLRAIHGLEDVLASEASGREVEWCKQVADGFRHVRNEIGTHRATMAAPDGLLAEIELATPEAEPQIQALQEAQHSLLGEADRLLEEIEQVASGTPTG